jgi:TerB N-terminal domain
MGAIRKAPAWIPLLALPALLLDRGWLLAGGMIIFWLWLLYRSRAKAAQLTFRQERKTEFERSAYREAARAFMADVVEAANRGDLVALQRLLERWHENLPLSAKPFTARLERAPGGGCLISGLAIGPDDIPTAMPRLGRGRKVIFDKRPVGDVDEDLTELNAACVFSLFLTLFGDADRAFVHLRLDMPTAPDGEIPWVRLVGRIGYAELQSEFCAMETPSEAIRALGGTVGRRQGKRFYAAEDPVVARPGIPMTDPPKAVPEPIAERTPLQAQAPARAAFATVHAGASTSTGSSEAVPPRPGQPTWTKSTPQRPDGIGPDPAALRAGQMNPDREGKVLDAIRGGEAGSTVASLIAATDLREPTVKYFGISADEAGLIEALRIGGVYHFIVREDDDKATDKARELREAVLELRDTAALEARKGQVRARPGQVTRNRAAVPPQLTPAEPAAEPNVPRNLIKSPFVTERTPPLNLGDKQLSSLEQWHRLGKASFFRLDSDASVPPGTTNGEEVPPPPADRAPVSGEPTPRDMRGPFGVVAKRWAEYEGNSDARFVPFNHYYPTYENLDAAQLRCYFGWRRSLRAGKTPPTDLSYLFIHVYELIHVIGVPDLRKAGSELERLWTGYRGTYPKLDNYLVPWIADLYATESLTDEVTGWYRRAAAAGAKIPDPELVTDLYWAVSDYPGMPRVALATLTGDPKLGTNKFCQEHNGDGWVERGYREALAIADSAFKARRDKTVREATLETGGLQPLTRKPFNAAVYDWRRNPVTLANLPDLREGSLAVTIFRAASRYAENLLREQRKFKSRLRGIEIDPDIAAALDRRLALFLKATRTRTRVTIDVAKAQELDRESAEVRNILLAGAESNGAPVAVTIPVVPGSTPEGLLTDLAAIAAAIGACSPEARAVLEAFLASNWELGASDPKLSTAAGAALVAPLIDEINGHAVTAARDILIVTEGETYVVQEDFRDEVYCVLCGNLEGFGQGVGIPVQSEDTLGFGPSELEALRILADGDDVANRLDALGAAIGSSGLLLIDRLNELALTSPHSDIIIDAGQNPPTLIDDGREWISSLLARLSQDPALSLSLITR